MDAAVRRGGVSAVVEYDYTAQEPDELDLVKGAIIHSIKQMPDGWWEGTLQATGKTGMFPDNFVRVLDTGENSAVTMRDKSAAVNRRCKVIYSYTQVNDDELSLAVGDVIEFLGEVEEGWWRGRLKTKIGVFPSNFVVSIEPSPILASKRPPTVGGASAIKTAANSGAAAASSTAATTATKKTNRLSFHSSKEDLLSSTTTTTTNTTTSAAAAPVPIDEVAPSLPPKPQRDFCRVEYPYAPQNDDELELKVGDIITIINMDLPDKGWWKGELRGKVGVFPDNFVKLLASTEVSPLNDSQQQPQSRTAKTTNVSSITATATSINSNSSTTASKVFIKKSGSSSSSTQSSNRKDSFGSRDSLNDILSETGLPSGNVAAQRKSLENKNLDLSHAPDVNTRLGLKKTQLQESKNIVISTSSTTTVSSMSSNSSTSEMRKSLENLDDKTKTPPPKLSKKPTVPSKKTTAATSVATVAGKIFPGIKPKMETVESKLITATSVDTADGIGSSKITRGGLPDSSSGNVLIRRAATIAVEDSDFDSVERASILTDMRAGRVKAPKRRPPSAAINVIGESNNNNSVYLNGSSNNAVGSDQSQSEDSKLLSSDDNSTGEESLAKPKPREWDKKAPWMEELKASQVKKKTSPSVEPRTGLGSVSSSIADRTSKLLAADESKISSSNATSVISSSSTSTSNSSVTTKVQSSSISSSVMQQSMTVESSQQSAKKELYSNSMADMMTKSVSTKLALDVDDVRARPNSLSIRNRSISPSLSGVRNSLKTSASPAADAASNPNSSNSNANSTAAKSTSSIVNNHHENNIGKGVPTEGARVAELEKRVEKLEGVVQTQQRTIDELVRMLREETDLVRVLRGELDKYAQCVTQV